MDKFDRLLSRPHLSGPKRQHYLPRFYLDGFTDSGGKLAVFDRTTGDTRIQTPANSGLIGHFYSFEDKQGRRRFDIEAMFNAVETLAAPVICKLDCRETLKAEEFDPLISFIALAALRTPAAIEDAKAVHAGVVRAQSRTLLSDPERVYKLLRETEGQTASELELRSQARAVAEMVRTDAYDIEVDGQFALMQSLKQFEAIGRSLLRRNIQALYPESELDTFITTDSPVVLGATSKVPKGAPLGFGSAEAVILFPVSKRCALAMSGASEQFRQVTQSQREVDWFNIQVAKNSYRYVFATAETELKTLADAIGIAGSEWTSSYQVDTLAGGIARITRRRQ